MINLKKIVAVILATTMCMGLSVTAFATDAGDAAATLTGWNLNSPFYAGDTDNDVAAPSGVTVDTTNSKGEENNQLTTTGDALAYGSKAYNSINTTEEVLGVLKENGYGVEAGAKIIPIAVGEVNGLNVDGDNVLAFTMPAGQFTTDPYDDHNDKYHPGDTVYGLFETGENTGVWEMREGIINDDGKVNFTVDHKGAFVIIKSMKNGKLVKLTKDSNGNDVQPPVVIDPTNPDDNKTPSTDKPGTSNKPAAGAATTGTSPKTGEF